MQVNHIQASAFPIRHLSYVHTCIDHYETSRCEHTQSQKQLTAYVSKALSCYSPYSSSPPSSCLLTYSLALMLDRLSSVERGSK